MVLNNFTQLQADTDFEVVIIDFGLAKNLSTLNANSTILGNVLFWPPEGKMWDDEGWGHWNSDIFSIAAMTVFLMCPLPAKKNSYDYTETELIEHVTKTLSTSDPN